VPATSRDGARDSITKWEGRHEHQFQHVGTNQCLDTVSAQNSQLMQFTCDPTGQAQQWIVQ
jgi:hypothetical protein